MVLLGMITLMLAALALAVPLGEGKKTEKPSADLTIYESLNLDNYDLSLNNYGDIIDLSNYDELYDYGDLAPKVRQSQQSTRARGAGAFQWGVPPSLCGAWFCSHWGGGWVS